MSRWAAAHADQSVAVRGSGVAALTCARLLSGQGWRVGLENHHPGRPLHLLLTASTAALLAEMWDSPQLFEGGHLIDVRSVSWGMPPGFHDVPAPGVSIDADALCRRLGERLQPHDAAGAAWMLDATSASRDDPVRCFGQRQAWISAATLRPGVRPHTCVMAMVERGWVFLLPTGGRGARLQLITPRAEGPSPCPATAAAAMRAVSHLAGDFGAWSGPFPSMARLRLSPGRVPGAGRPGVLAVGEAAAAFDPIGGDGVGHAIRGAVLAVSVLQAVAGGAPPSVCLGRYASLLSRAMRHHLHTCLQLYRNGGAGWHDEITSMEDGLRLLAR